MSRAPLEDVAPLVAAIEGSADEEALHALVRTYARSIGYDRFVLYSVATDRDEVIDQIFWIEGDWFGEGAEVDAETYLARCPVTRHVLETEEPFSRRRPEVPAPRRIGSLRFQAGPEFTDFRCRSSGRRAWQGQ